MFEGLAGTLDGIISLEYLGTQQIILKRILGKQDMRV